MKTNSTQQAQHTPGPWIVGNGNRIYMGAAMEKREIAVATRADPSIRAQSEANAARIVACVNACEQFADPAEAVRLLCIEAAKAYPAEAAREFEADAPAMRCNRCGAGMLGTSAYDGAHECGGLIEAT